MKLTFKLKLDNKITSLLLAVQAIGAVFVGIFLAAYLGGLVMTPSTTVLHSETAFRTPLTVFGIALLVLVLAGIILATVLNANKHR